VQLGHQFVAVEQRQLEVGKSSYNRPQYLFPGTLFWRYSGNVCCDKTS
jgi:hypothetical protein